MNSKPRNRWVIVICIAAALALLPTPLNAQATPLLPLAEPGPYHVGFKVIVFRDMSREGRELAVSIWYPAIDSSKPSDKLEAGPAMLITSAQLKEMPSRRSPTITNLEGGQLLTLIETQKSWSRVKIDDGSSGWVSSDNVASVPAAPDLKGHPYPLILFSPSFSGTNRPELEIPLASWGFVVVGVQSHPNDTQQNSLIDRPLDMLFILDQLTASNQSRWGGLIDTDHVGVMGTCYGGYTTLALTGARINPASASKLGLVAPVAGDKDTDRNPRALYTDWNWDNLMAYRAKLAPLENNELWPPFTDKRIAAALAFSPCWESMFGESGLATATVPTLIVGGTIDGFCAYEQDNVYPYNHLGSQDRYLLSIIHGGHLAGVGMPIITQLEVALFGYYLQGHKDYAQYLTKAYIDRVEAELKQGLVWGPYKEPSTN